MNYKKIIFGIAILIGTASCKKTFDNLLNDPNNPSPSAADVDLFPIPPPCLGQWWILGIAKACHMFSFVGFLQEAE